MTADTRTNQELAGAVRRSVMASMAFTEKHPAAFTHDDYDDAHAALSELVRRAATYREALKEIVNTLGPVRSDCQQNACEGCKAEASIALDLAREALKEEPT